MTPVTYLAWCSSLIRVANAGASDCGDGSFFLRTTCASGSSTSRNAVSTVSRHAAPRALRASNQFVLLTCAPLQVDRRKVSCLGNPDLRCWRYPVNLVSWSHTYSPARLSKGFLLVIPPPPRSNRLPYTTLCRTSRLP